MLPGAGVRLPRNGRRRVPPAGLHPHRPLARRYRYSCFLPTSTSIPTLTPSPTVLYTRSGQHLLPGAAGGLFACTRDRRGGQTRRRENSQVSWPGQSGGLLAALSLHREIIERLCAFLIPTLLGRSCCLLASGRTGVGRRTGIIHAHSHPPPFCRNNSTCRQRSRYSHWLLPRRRCTSR